MIYFMDTGSYLLDFLSHLRSHLRSGYAFDYHTPDFDNYCLIKTLISPQILATSISVTLAKILQHMLFTN